MYRAIASFFILAVFATPAFSQVKRYNTPNATRFQVGNVKYYGARPYTPTSPRASRGMQVGAVTYLNGVRPYTPTSPRASRGMQVGAVTYFGTRPYTPTSPRARAGMQVGSVTYLGGVRPYTPRVTGNRGTQHGAVTYFGRPRR